MQDKTKGAWIIHHGQKLMDTTYVPGHDPVSTAAKAGLLLSALAESKHQTTLPTAKVAAIAAATGISHLELHPLLQILQDNALLKHSATGVDVLGVSPSSVLTHTASIFDGLGPTNENIACLPARIDLAADRVIPW